MSDLAFSQLALPTPLLECLTSLEYHQMTAVQAQSLPAILDGKDVIAQAKTGSGKTAAFALGLLAKLDVKRYRIQTLVLCPTRELAEQVAAEIRKLARNIHNIKVLTLCGGVPSRSQIVSLEHGAHIIVGTPGRVLDHLQQQRLDLTELTTLVLDEADRMLEMGFADALNAILANVPTERQTLLFSATFDKAVRQIADSIMQNPVTVTVTSPHTQSSIEQQFYQLDGTRRSDAVKLLLHRFQPSSTVVFCNTKRETQELADTLKLAGVSVMALHGDLEQRDREHALLKFSNNSVSVLVATDVAARGLDIDKLDLVINYQLAHDVATHTHRIGRTGRAGNSGLACSLLSPDDGAKLSALAGQLELEIDALPLPSESVLAQALPEPAMQTLQIDGGKKHKLRPGDIVGALTSSAQIVFADIGKIQMLDTVAFVAVSRRVAKQALTLLNDGKMKGKKYRVWRL
ncbi:MULTISPECIES: ATP-dependent RNA helicase DbpA [unclassified Arsukibacterium]|uniref:ATP-dependent RNA helicase DbpA n=1 Tax=unclassified Arsukibacterium TaxID=2635278 RepID=UPI000C8978D4|nr:MULTISPECIES: ATP-dependent RNA helicase DbpA [unclassified Arsukibacterium]MAA95442.1 ATP-dependent RNA helicase DbpA [Rheinheimera sp.]HAW92865.1 ATP-dependent RNA helicase DbpA [Candidatus Azambacteria bacterium]